MNSSSDSFGSTKILPESRREKKRHGKISRKPTSKSVKLEKRSTLYKPILTAKKPTKNDSELKPNRPNKPVPPWLHVQSSSPCLPKKHANGPKWPKTAWAPSARPGMKLARCLISKEKTTLRLKKPSMMPTKTIVKPPLKPRQPIGPWRPPIANWTSPSKGVRSGSNDTKKDRQSKSMPRNPETPTRTARTSPKPCWRGDVQNQPRQINMPKQR